MAMKPAEASVLSVTWRLGSGSLRVHDLPGQVHDNFDELLEADHQPAEMRPLG